MHTAVAYINARSDKTVVSSVVKLWGTRGNGVPLLFWRGNAVPLAYTTAVGGRGGTWRTPRPLHHQLKSKYGQFFARKSQVLLHSSDTTLLLRYRLIAVGVTYRN